MKKLAIVGLLMLGCFLLGCGSTIPATTSAVGGEWESSLVGPPAGQTLFNFITNFSVTGSNALSVSYLNFLTTGQCFTVTGVGEIVGGTFVVTSLESDPTATANFTFTVTGAGNTLSMTGTATGITNTVAQTTTWNAITGSWTLTGNANCTTG